MLLKKLESYLNRVTTPAHPYATDAIVYMTLFPVILLQFRGESTNWLSSFHLYGTNVSQLDETLDYIAVSKEHRIPTNLTPMEVHS